MIMAINHCGMVTCKEVRYSDEVFVSDPCPSNADYIKPDEIINDTMMIGDSQSSCHYLLLSILPRPLKLLR